MADMTDIAVALDDLSRLMDVTVFAGDLDTSNALVSASLVSLFSDARAEEGDTQVAGEDPRGWWGDSYATDGKRLGCRWWTRRREVVTDEVARWFGATGTEALKWMVEDGWAKRAAVAAYRVPGRRNGLAILVEIVRPTGEGIRLDVSNLWESLANG